MKQASISHSSWRQKITLILIFFFTYLTSHVYSQSVEICGVVPQNTATSSNPDSILYDRFGNTYDIFSVYNPSIPRQSCNAGYFELTFTGFESHLDMLPTICKVFEYVSGLVSQRINLTPCGDIITPSPVKIAVSATQTGVASASPLWEFFGGVNCDFIYPSRVYQKINGGYNPISGDDGVLNINTAFLTWHKDHTIPMPEPQPGQLLPVDLYSAVLHEVMHILGFASLIGINGTPAGSFNNFSMWDQHLHTTPNFNPSGQSSQITQVINSNCQENCWSLNSTTFPNLSVFTDAISNSCSDNGQLDFIFGTSAIAPISGGNGTIPADDNAIRNMLSHLHPTCGGQDENYVVQTGLHRGFERRTLSQAELEILCELGYKLPSCDGCYNASNFSRDNLNVSQALYQPWCCTKIYKTCLNTPLIIPFEELLCNKFTNGNELTITDAYWKGFSNATVEIVGNTIQSTPLSIGNAPYYEIIYTVKGCDCNLQNYVLQVHIDLCLPCEDPDPCLNLICKPDFDDLVPANGPLFLHEYAAGGFWIFNDSGGNSPDVCQLSNDNNYVRIGSTSFNKEGLSFQLEESIMPGCSVYGTILASANFETLDLEIFGSEHKPCPINEAMVNHGNIPTDCGSYIFNPVYIARLPIENKSIPEDIFGCPDDPNFKEYPFEWHNLETFPINYIILSPKSGAHMSAVIHVDELVVTKICSEPCFTYDIQCPLINLQPCFEITDQSHFWDFGDGNTSNNSSPSHTYVNDGTYTITHTVTDNCGNMQTVTEEIIIQCDPFCQPDLVNKVIETSITWTTSNTPNNGDFKIFDDLVVESGATLTIAAGVTIHFGPDSKLIIKPNAKVILHGTLTGAECKGFTWEGVRVYGSTPEFSQYTVNGSVAQGRFEGRPGSEIIHAEVAIQLYGPTPALAGGQVSLRETVIRNCRIGVEFAPYQNFFPYSIPASQTGQPRDYNSTFIKVDFVNDNEYAHVDHFYAFMHMTRVNRINMLGCSMRNGHSFKSDKIVDWGYGIFANDAGFSVAAYCEDGVISIPDNCEEYTYPSFYGLGYGVYAGRMGTNRPYTVKNATFQNCYFGVHNSGVASSTLLFNKFEFGALPSTEPTNEQIGVFYEDDAAGLTCEENEFYDPSVSNLYSTLGILSHNTGTANKVIRRNKFENLNCHNVARETNSSTIVTQGDRGLYYDCNQNYDVLDRDFNVLDGAIRRIQGLIVNSSSIPSAAGNRFSNTQVDFANDGNLIDYFYNSSGNNQTPVWVLGGINLIASAINSCPVEFCDPPCRTQLEIQGLKTEYYSEKAGLNTTRFNYISNPTTLGAREIAFKTQILDENSSLIVLHSQIDTLSYSKDSVLLWIQNLESLEGNLWYANELASVGNISLALTKLTNTISQFNLTGSDSLDIIRYKSIVSLLDGEDIYSLQNSTVQTIKDYVGLGGFSEAWAKRIVTKYGYNFTPEYINCQGLFRPGTVSILNAQKIEEKINITVSPNPAKDEVLFVLTMPHDPEELIITIYDFSGKVIHQQKNFTNLKSFIWNSSIHPSGVYLYQIQEKGMHQFSGKVILQK